MNSTITRPASALFAAVVALALWLPTLAAPSAETAPAAPLAFELA